MGFPTKGKVYLARQQHMHGSTNEPFQTTSYQNYVNLLPSVGLRFGANAVEQEHLPHLVTVPGYGQQHKQFTAFPTRSIKWRKPLAMVVA